MISRNGAALTYDAENRLTGVSGGASASFVYDGDGVRVKATFATTTTLYVGNYYELTTLYQEDFDDGVADGWTVYAGTWGVQNQAYRQSNTTHTNTNAYRALTQNEPLAYQWTITFTTGTQAGLYLFASSATGTERGNAYRVWQDASYMRIYESVNNTAYLRASFAAANAAGQTHTYRALYDATSGKLQVWRDGTYLGSWTDASRLTSGAYLSLRTTSTEARFDNLVVYRPVSYDYLAGQRVAMRKGGVAYSVVTDQLGSTSVMRNTSSGQVLAMRYYPWGATRAGSLPTDYKFTGQRLDDLTGLYYYGARYYDPVLGRWIQPDTIVPDPGAPQDLNRFSYVRNNPLRYTDPIGHWTFERTPDDYKFLPPTEDLPAIRLSSVEAMVAFEIWPFPVEVSSEAQSPQPQLEYSDPTVWDAPEYMNDGLPRTPNGIGMRLDFSWTPPPLKIIGGDLNLEVIDNADTSEVNLFTTPGLQVSPPGIPQVSAGLVLIYDLPDDPNQYATCCALTVGANVGIAEFDIAQPLDPTASGPIVVYMGISSPSLGVSPYAVASRTFRLWNLHNTR